MDSTVSLRFPQWQGPSCICAMFVYPVPALARKGVGLLRSTLRAKRENLSPPLAGKLSGYEGSSNFALMMVVLKCSCQMLDCTNPAKR